MHWIHYGATLTKFLLEFIDVLVGARKLQGVSMKSNYIIWPCFLWSCGQSTKYFEMKKNLQNYFVYFSCGVFHSLWPVTVCVRCERASMLPNEWWKFFMRIVFSWLPHASGLVYLLMVLYLALVSCFWYFLVGGFAWAGSIPSKNKAPLDYLSKIIYLDGGAREQCQAWR